ncbi:ankyrin repeat domain-containing protein [Streptomyces celluloflavus]|uniref:ankyrin repeat domain-containing protein n=1 Tax=Streptomyces celluloflavus TaxID=58344 RepID=UPI00369A8C83
MDMVDQLAQAASDGDATAAGRLLKKGVVVDALNSDRCTALELAVRRGHSDVVRLLIEAGANLEQQAGEYRELTLLCLAALQGHTAVIGALLDAGAHPEARSRIGYVPLVLAATAGGEGDPQTVDLLLDRGADINVVMKDRTPLDWAAGFGQVQMVRQLLDRGATPTVKSLTIARDQAERRPGNRQKYERIIDALHAAGITTGTDHAIRHPCAQQDGREAENQA